MTTGETQDMRTVQWALENNETSELITPKIEAALGGLTIQHYLEADEAQRVDLLRGHLSAVIGVEGGIKGKQMGRLATEITGIVAQYGPKPTVVIQGEGYEETTRRGGSTNLQQEMEAYLRAFAGREIIQRDGIFAARFDPLLVNSFIAAMPAFVIFGAGVDEMLRLNEREIFNLLKRAPNTASAMDELLLKMKQLVYGDLSEALPVLRRFPTMIGRNYGPLLNALADVYSAARAEGILSGVTTDSAAFRTQIGEMDTQVGIVLENITTSLSGGRDRFHLQRIATLYNALMDASGTSDGINVVDEQDNRLRAAAILAEATGAPIVNQLRTGVLQERILRGLLMIPTEGASRAHILALGQLATQLRVYQRELDTEMGGQPQQAGAAFQPSGTLAKGVGAERVVKAWRWEIRIFGANIGGSGVSIR